MSKNSKLKREAKRYKECNFKPSDVLKYEKSKNKLEPITETQRQYISSLFHDNFVIGCGSAGAGKTYIASRVAAQIYTSDKSIENIILTRPNIETGEKMGFLPGEIQDKYAPYLVPFEKGLKDELGSKFQSDLYRRIIPKPLAYMRGETFDNSIIMLDEAQNTTIKQMKMFITRVGIGSRMFITGDEKQSDIRGKNGLEWLIEQIIKQNLPYEIVKFNDRDCVRSGLCKEMLKLIENEV